jgi:hypothetical protein
MNPTENDVVGSESALWRALRVSLVKRSLCLGPSCQLSFGTEGDDLVRVHQILGALGRDVRPVMFCFEGSQRAMMRARRIAKDGSRTVESFWNDKGTAIFRAPSASRCVTGMVWVDRQKQTLNGSIKSARSFQVGYSHCKGADVFIRSIKKGRINPVVGGASQQHTSLPVALVSAIRSTDSTGLRILFSSAPALSKPIYVKPRSI